MSFLGLRCCTRLSFVCCFFFFSHFTFSWIRCLIFLLYFSLDTLVFHLLKNFHCGFHLIKFCPLSWLCVHPWLCGETFGYDFSLFNYLLLLSWPYVTYSVFAGLTEGSLNVYVHLVLLITTTSSWVMHLLSKQMLQYPSIYASFLPVFLSMLLHVFCYLVIRYT